MDSRYRFIESPRERQQLALFRSGGAAVLIALLLAIAVVPAGSPGNPELSDGLPPSPAAAAAADAAPVADAPRNSTHPAAAPVLPQRQHAPAEVPVLEWISHAALHG